MFKNRLKKLGCAFALAACLMGVSTPVVHANTTPFTFTVSSWAQLNTDTKSLRTAKDDNEQFFYVTPLTFNYAGEINVTSKNLAGTVVSYSKTLSNLDVNSTRYQSYGNYAAPNVMYYLEAAFKSSPVTNQLKVTGRYTP